MVPSLTRRRNLRAMAALSETRVSPRVPQLSLHTPVGPLTVSAEDDAIFALDWGWGCMQTATPLLRAACDQLHDYFDGRLRAFELAVRPAGSPFQRAVWSALLQIPYGQTRTYREVAAEAGGCARSVGQANRRNPLPILIPCHRVVSQGGIGGFTSEGGVETKRFLIALERG